ncbi:hypothetical protein [Capnocytophaga leadbetteri]|jgi:hypothetical protein|uniref:hypothetical protein n=1 Tax=Capnocytophaga leadbetteri TaxID=327575 RepID=UPI0028D0E655|nr:hypothetical protein [Capnocytophaga leadbetteri]
MAISDYMNPLIVEAVDSTSYIGRTVGESISVMVVMAAIYTGSSLQMEIEV